MSLQHLLMNNQSPAKLLAATVLDAMHIHHGRVKEVAIQVVGISAHTTQQSVVISIKMETVHRTLQFQVCHKALPAGIVSIQAVDSLEESLFKIHLTLFMEISFRIFQFLPCQEVPVLEHLSGHI
jgi:hypothetical protein